MKIETRTKLHDIMISVASGVYHYGEALDESMKEGKELTPEQIRDMATGILCIGTGLMKTIEAILKDEDEETGKDVTDGHD